LGEFSPIGHFWKILKVDTFFHDKNPVLTLTKMGWATFWAFFTNSSGHPAFDQRFWRKCGTLKIVLIATIVPRRKANTEYVCYVYMYICMYVCNLCIIFTLLYMSMQLVIQLSHYKKDVP
jgi:hypothetical protein